MKIGPYTIRVHDHGSFRLDGGAMFGSVPKTLWNREAPADDANRILLATRSLVIEDGERRILVDVGCGDKWTEKLRSIYCISDRPYLPVEGVTDVVLTHLHFDHGGGVSRYQDGKLTPCYPAARHWVSAVNYENARNPHPRERASYLPENVDVLSQVDLRLTEDGDEVLPGLSVHQVHGHTRGLQWIRLADDHTTLVYPADLIPTSKHLPVPYVMGYDMCAERAMAEKEALLKLAIAENWIILFEHDPELAAARVTSDERGRPVVREPLQLDLA